MSSMPGTWIFARWRHCSVATGRGWLSEAGLEAVQLVDQEAIFTAVGRRLAQAGVGSFFFLMTEDGQGLMMVHRELPGASAVTPMSPLGRIYPFSKLPLLRLVCESRRPQYLGDPELLLQRTADNVGPHGMEQARRLSRALGMQAAISAPLVARDRVIGAITVVGPALRQADVPAMAAFANQTAAAMEAARLLSPLAHLGQGVDYGRIEVGPASPANPVERLLDGCARRGVELLSKGVDGADQTGLDRDRLASQPIRIALAVMALMVRAHDRRQGGQRREARQELGPHHRVGHQRRALL